MHILVFDEENEIEYLIDNDSYSFDLGKLDFININYDYLKFINTYLINSKSPPSEFK